VVALTLAELFTLCVGLSLKSVYLRIILILTTIPTWQHMLGAFSLDVSFLDLFLRITGLRRKCPAV
jgi:hypothetical protein